MNLAPLAPIAVGIATQLVLLLTERNEHLAVDGCSVYRWSRALVLFLVVGCGAMSLFMASNASLTDPLAGKVVVAVFVLSLTLSCLYFYRYRVIVDATSIRAGAFSLKKIAFRDVVRARYVQGQNSGQIILCDSNGKKINIWETIGDFGACAREISSRLPTGVSLNDEGRMTNYLHGKR